MMMAALSFKPELTLSVLVTDWDAARRWYSEKLGFQEMYAIEEVGWAELQTPLGGATIGLNRLEGAHPGPGSVTITFGVQDIEATRAELEKRGVQFDGPTNEIPGMVKLATFHDPDGNAMMLAQTLGQ
jgi:predicted enzyme related to lactoylglutathione lyase